MATRKKLEQRAKSICRTQFPSQRKDNLLQFENRVEVSGLGILSTFRLSQNENFQAPLEAVLSDCGAMFSRKQNSLFMVIAFPFYNGECHVHRNGIVRCFGQKSLMEVDAVALKIAWEFGKVDPDVGVFDLRSSCVHTAFELPFQVNLSKLHSFFRERVVFDPQIQKGATIRFEDLGSSVTVQKSGKIAIQCTLDGKVRDDDLPNTMATATSVSLMTGCAMIEGSEKARTTSPNIEMEEEEDAALENQEPSKDEEADGAVTSRSRYGRTIRRPKDYPQVDLTCKSRQEKEFERELDRQYPHECYERRLAQFFMAYTNTHGSAAASEAMEILARSETTTPDTRFAVLRVRKLFPHDLPDYAKDIPLKIPPIVKKIVEPEKPVIPPKVSPIIRIANPVEPSSFHKRVRAAAMGVCRKITDFDAYPLRSRIRALFEKPKDA